jgi:hypothetical protein
LLQPTYPFLFGLFHRLATQWQWAWMNIHRIGD